MVILVALLGRRRIEGKFVVGICIGHGPLQQSADIVAGAQGKSAGLSRDHLQGKVADINLAWLANALQKRLIVEVTLQRFAGSQRIDAIKRDVSLSKPPWTG